MKDPDGAKLVKLSLKTAESKEVEEFGLTVTNKDIVYEHDEEHQATVGYFDVKKGWLKYTMVLCLGNQESWEGYLFNFFGEQAGRADLEIVKVEMNKVFALGRGNRISLANVEFYLWSIVKEEDGGFTVYFKLREKDKEEVMALLKYPDEEKSTHTAIGKALTVVKVINEDFVHLIIKDA